MTNMNKPAELMRDTVPSRIAHNLFNSTDLPPWVDKVLFYKDMEQRIEKELESTIERGESYIELEYNTDILLPLCANIYDTGARCGPAEEGDATFCVKTGSAYDREEMESEDESEDECDVR
jgi:hypothetical protein